MPQLPPSPAFQCLNLFPKRSLCPRPTRFLWGPSSTSQALHHSTTSLLGSQQASQPPGSGSKLSPNPNPNPHNQHLDHSPHRSPFHSSLHISSLLRPQGLSPLPHLPTPLPLSLVAWGSHYLPCTASSIQAHLKTLFPHTQGLCLSLVLGLLILILPWHMARPLPLGPWVLRQPLFLFEAPHQPVSPPLVPTWCLHLPHRQRLAPYLQGLQQQSHRRVCAEVLQLQTCCLLAPRASTEALSLLGVGSPCCSLPR